VNEVRCDPRRICAGLLAACSVFVASPAPADDGTDVLSAMRAAFAAAHSFDVYMESTNHGTVLVQIEQVVVRPDSIHIISNLGDGYSDWMAIGHAGYSRDDDGTWHASKWYPQDLLADEYVAPFLRDGATATPLPNRQDGDTTVGAVQIINPPTRFSDKYTSRAYPMTCTYDLSTYLPRVCSFKAVTGTIATSEYTRWNSPDNVVEAPSGLTPPTPPPSAAP
jgi:hypothetical protein